MAQDRWRDDPRARWHDDRYGWGGEPGPGPERHGGHGRRRDRQGGHAFGYGSDYDRGPWRSRPEYEGRYGQSSGPHGDYPGYGRGYGADLDDDYGYGYRRGESYADRPRRQEADRGRGYGAWYGQASPGYSHDRSDYRFSSHGQDHGRGGRDDDRDWWDRTKDQFRAWGGDDDARHRREMDEARSENRGRGPRGYTRSDERIREDVSDRLSDDWRVDASDIEVAVASGEVTLSGHVANREDKRRAEDLAESCSGVKHVQNNLRVREREAGGSYGTAATASPEALRRVTDG